jgi:photosystem II stability/assembly factor-like uncharacterized protein
MGTSAGIYRKMLTNSNWEYSTSGISLYHTQMLSTLAKIGNTIYASFLDGTIYKSTDNGLTWVINNNIPPSGGFSFFTHTDKIIFFNYSGVHYYSNDGQNWDTIPSSIYNIIPACDSFSIMSYGGNNYIVKKDFSIITLPNGVSQIDNIEPSGNFLYSLGTDNKVYRLGTTPLDTAWTYASDFPFDPLALFAIGSPTFPISISSTDNAVFLSLVGESSTGNRYTKIFRSTDHASTWTELIDPTLDVPIFLALKKISNSKIIANDIKGNILVSNDDGLSWSKQSDYFIANSQERFLIMDNSILMNVFRNSSYTSDGIIKSTDNGNTWTLSNSGLIPNIDMDYDSTQNYFHYNFFFKHNNVAFYGRQEPSQLFRSFNEGSTWDSIALPNYSDYLVATVGGDENTFFIVTAHDTGSFNQEFTFYRTDDYGNTWQIEPSFLPLDNNPTSVLPFKIIGRNDTMLTIQKNYVPNPDEYKLYKSIDNGVSWVDESNGIFDNPYRTIDFRNDAGSQTFVPIIEFSYSTTKFMAVITTHDSVNYYSTTYDTLYMFDNGVWTKLNSTGLPADIDMQSLKYSNGGWILGSNSGVFSSNDDGITWQNSISALTPMSYNNREYTNDGLILGIDITSIDNNSSNTFVASRTYGCWTNSTPVGISENLRKTNKVLLYPNPTNTNEVSLKLEGEHKKCEIEIYDIAGRLLFRENLNINNSIDLHNLSSGIYILKIKLDNCLIQEKLVVNR